MSCSYADGLSPYHDKGKLGLAEKFDDASDVSKKVKILADWINHSKHVVIHTGAGISTSAGIPDFRGPKGVWTLQEKGEKPTINVSFNEAIPTKTHMAILKLLEAGKVQFVISQNIDGLHLRSGISRKHLAELHGNMFIEQCHGCQRQFVRSSATTSVGQKCLEKPCPTSKSSGRPCRGKLHDTILDWEHDLPEKDLGLADFHSCLADLSICLGTTLQIIPSGTLPLSTKKYNAGKLVICNLQPTKYDKKADLLIHTYVDDIMVQLMKELDLTLPEFDSRADPSRLSEKSLVEWTIADSEVKRMRALYEHVCCKSKKKRKLPIERNEDEIPRLKSQKDSSETELKAKLDTSIPISVKKSDVRISEELENGEPILRLVKQEPQSDDRSDLVVVENRDSNKETMNESKSNPSKEFISTIGCEKIDDLPFYDGEKNDSLNRVDVFQKEGSSEDSVERSETPFDANLDTSACGIKKEILV